MSDITIRLIKGFASLLPFARLSLWLFDVGIYWSTGEPWADLRAESRDTA